MVRLTRNQKWNRWNRRENSNTVRVNVIVWYLMNILAAWYVIVITYEM